MVKARVMGFFKDDSKPHILYKFRAYFSFGLDFIVIKF